MNAKVMLTLAGATVVTLFSTVTAVVTSVRANRTMKKMNQSFSKVEEMTEEKISEALIRKAIEKATDAKVDNYMALTKMEVLKTADKNLEIQAKNAVESCARDIRKQAGEKISRQVSNLDVEQLKKEVRNQAEKHVLEKLDGCLDASVKRFKDHLEYTKKVHDRYAIAYEEEEDDAKGVRLVLIDD